MGDRVGHLPQHQPAARVAEALAGESAEVAVDDIRAVDRVDEVFTGSCAGVEVERRLHGVGQERARLGRNARAIAAEVEKGVRCEVALALFHLGLVGLEQLSVEPSAGPDAEHVRGEVDGLAVHAELGEVGREGLSHRHLEGVHVPGAARVARLADGDVVRGLERACVTDAESVLHLKHGRPEAPIGRVVEGSRVTEERLTLVVGVARGAVGIGHVRNPEEVLGADRPSGLDVARGVPDLPLRVDTL